MAHKHSVYDTSLHFIIDGNTRLVKNSTEAKVTLVQYDHNSERITFELPRYIDGHDMSLCTYAQVHYINIERKTNRESTGVYECDDLQIAPDDENVVICSWLISKNATRFVGSLFFVIRFICSEDREVTYSWNTARHTGLSVTDGIYNGEDVDEIVESDAFKIFEETIEAANTAIKNANEATEKANNSILHIRYSKYADGKDFVDVCTPMYDYIGVATGLTAPTDPSGYQWSRFNAKGYWTGSTEEYNAIPDDEIIDDYLYIPDDDTFFEDLKSGSFKVANAKTAGYATEAGYIEGVQKRVLKGYWDNFEVPHEETVIGALIEDDGSGVERTFEVVTEYHGIFRIKLFEKSEIVTVAVDKDHNMSFRTTDRYTLTMHSSYNKDNPSRKLRIKEVWEIVDTKSAEV